MINTINEKFTLFRPVHDFSTSAWVETKLIPKWHIIIDLLCDICYFLAAAEMFGYVYYELSAGFLYDWVRR